MRNLRVHLSKRWTPSGSGLWVPAPPCTGRDPERPHGRPPWQMTGAQLRFLGAAARLYHGTPVGPILQHDLGVHPQPLWLVMIRLGTNRWWSVGCWDPRTSPHQAVEGDDVQWRGTFSQPPGAHKSSSSASRVRGPAD